jgi:hypothetical protein
MRGLDLIELPVTCRFVAVFSSGAKASGLPVLSVQLVRLVNCNRKPAQIQVRQQPDLPAGQFQHGALLVCQHDRA